MKIVVLDGWANNPGDLSWEPLERLGDCIIYDRTSPDEVIERSREAEVVLTNKVTFTRETIAQLPRLRYIGVIATGYNIVDVDAARERGVIVTNVPAYSTNSVAQIVFAHLLNITTHADHYSRSVRSGRWSECRDFSYTDRPITEIAGKTIGIVGLGSIGMAVARIARAMEMKVVAYTSKSAEALPVGIEKAKDLDEVFSRGDVVSLHCPLTAETRGMVDARRLSLMKRTAILINTARGPLVDETELAAALRNGLIAAAAVDVMCQEPPERDNPLLKAPHCFFTPHIGWASVEARHRLMDILVENVARYIAGEPMNVVN